MIMSGEFEQFKVLKLKTIDTVEYSSLTGPFALRNRILKQKPRGQRKAGIIQHTDLLHKGIIVGDEDVIKMINYSKSTICKSTEAEVLWIDAVEFFRAIKQYPSTQDFIQSNAEHKQISNITSAAVNTHMQN